MVDKLYKIVHWIGVNAKGLREDQSPQGGVVSDSVVTMALREFREKESLHEILDKNPQDLFSSNFLVNSLNGETAAPLNKQEMFRIWMIFTLYMKEKVFPDEKDPRSVILQHVLEFVGATIQAAIEDTLKDLFKEVLSCDECEKKDICGAMEKEDKEEGPCEDKTWN